LADNIEMLNKIYDTKGISAIELNLACPNIPGKPVIAYDFEQMDHVLKTITSLPKFGTYPLGVKLAPYFDIPHFEKAASIIAKYPISFVVSINTVGNALFVDMENECEGICPKQGNNSSKQ
jgi:dihydroorotate dehydrogenase (fumarate)